MNEDNKILCPVCSKTEMEVGDYTICEVCSWENDPFQIDHPDMSGANKMSLNDFKNEYLKQNLSI
jgi:uncharacterized CHY-type Zn-finger protein